MTKDLYEYSWRKLEGWGCWGRVPLTTHLRPSPQAPLVMGFGSSLVSQCLDREHPCQSRVLPWAAGKAPACSSPEARSLALLISSLLGIVV